MGTEKTKETTVLRAVLAVVFGALGMIAMLGAIMLMISPEAENLKDIPTACLVLCCVNIVCFFGACSSLRFWVCWTFSLIGSFILFSTLLMFFSASGSQGFWTQDSYGFWRTILGYWVIGGAFLFAGIWALAQKIKKPKECKA